MKTAIPTNLLPKTLMIVLSALVALLIVEQGLRVIGFDYSPLKVSPDWRLYHALINKWYIYDPDLIWKPKRNTGLFNGQGFIGYGLLSEKQPDEYRIFTLGDSNTEGPWPFKMQGLLLQDHIMATVVNAGVTGYSSYQGLQRFKEILKFEPDMVLVCFGANDAHRVKRSDEEYARQMIRRIKIDRKLIRVKIGQLIIALSDMISWLHRGNFVHRVSPDAYEHNLEEMVALAQDHGVKIVLMTRPFTGETSDDNIWKTFAHIYRRKTREVARRHQVPLIDLYAFFKYQNAYFLDEAHFNADGHARAAEYILEHIKGHLPERVLRP